MFHRITNIIDVANFTVTCAWNTGEIRSISFEKQLKEWCNSEENIYRRLLNESTFKRVALDPVTKTLVWQGLIEIQSQSGEHLATDFDLDPEVLYEMSTLVTKIADQGSQAA